MTELTLYHIAPSRSSIVHWMLEELGEPFELKVLNNKDGESRKADYLSVNPMGKVPALRHGDVLITEGAAICTYLGDAFPKAGLAPAIGDKDRGPYLKWLFFTPVCLEAAIVDRMFERPPAPKGALGYGDFDTTIETIAAALKAGPYLLGERFTTADVVAGATLQWGQMVKVVPEREEFARYLALLNERPALQRAMKKDQELQASSNPYPG